MHTTWNTFLTLVWTSFGDCICESWWIENRYGERYSIDWSLISRWFQKARGLESLQPSKAIIHMCVGLAVRNVKNAMAIVLYYWNIHSDAATWELPCTWNEAASWFEKKCKNRGSAWLWYIGYLVCFFVPLHADQAGRGNPCYFYKRVPLFRVLTHGVS